MSKRNTLLFCTLGHRLTDFLCPKSSPPVPIKFHWNTAKSDSLHIFHGNFQATTTILGSYDKDYVAFKEAFGCLHLYKKYLSASDIVETILRYSLLGFLEHPNKMETCLSAVLTNISSSSHEPFALFSLFLFPHFVF